MHDIYSIMGQFERLPDFWWLVLLGVAFVSFLLQKQDKANKLISVLTPTYIAFIVIVTLLNRSEGGWYKLEPFWSYMAAYGAFHLWREIALNYLLFMPLGFLLKFRIKEIYQIGLIGICISGLIEVAQLMFRLGLFEFDDIIGNSIGCVLGAGIGLIIQKYLMYRKKKTNRKLRGA